MRELDEFDRVWLGTLSEDTKTIAYRPTFRRIAGSVTAAILLQQILYRWVRNDCQPFYKYKEPCDAADYRIGDSWCEELAFSREEFDGALKRIAQKVTREKPKSDDALVWYRVAPDRKTWYEVNYAALRKAAFPRYVGGKSTVTCEANPALPLLYTESITEITTENKNNNTIPDTPVVVEGLPLSKEIAAHRTTTDHDAMFQARRRDASTLAMRTLATEIGATLPDQWVGLAGYLDSLPAKTSYELCKWLWGWQALQKSSPGNGRYDPVVYEQQQQAEQWYGRLFENARSLPARIKTHIQRGEYLQLAPSDEGALRALLRERTDALLVGGTEPAPSVLAGPTTDAQPQSLPPIHPRLPPEPRAEDPLAALWREITAALPEGAQIYTRQAHLVSVADGHAQIVAPATVVPWLRTQLGRRLKRDFAVCGHDVQEVTIQEVGHASTS